MFGLCWQWIEATADGDLKVAQCGLELTHLTRDGLQGDPSEPGYRPRAVLSGTLYVEPRFRRQGMAQRMLREAEGQARWWGCDELLLMVQAKNKPAQTLYKKMGYVMHPQTKYHGTEICMTRKLFAPNLHTLLSVAPQHNKVDSRK